MFFSSYHNHSTWSDGTATIREMALAGRDAGLSEFGISDHFVVGPQPFAIDGRLWSMGLNELDAYIADALAVQRELTSPNFRVRIGMEVDYFPETVDLVNARLERLPLDYVIGAVHYADGFPIDNCKEFWQQLSSERCEEVWLRYVERIAECARRLRCNWIAHLDLPKKFGYFPSSSVVTALKGAIGVCAEEGRLLEINTAGKDKPCAEFYPSEELLKCAMERSVRILVNADAHATTQVTRHFADAYSWLKAQGATAFPYFEKRHCLWHEG